MITLQELNPHGYTTTVEIQNNLNILLERINKIRAAYGKPMRVTSGLRSEADQHRINPGAPKSKHCIGGACDILDDEVGTLWFWCINNLQILKDTGLWLEHGCYTHNTSHGFWTHFQVLPPASGHRIFIPSLEPNPNPGFWDGSYDSKFN